MTEIHGLDLADSDSSERNEAAEIVNKALMAS